MSALLPGDRPAPWCPTVCFDCGDPVPLADPAVCWAGQDVLLLHVGCAEKAALVLAGDAREAVLATGAPHWRRRAARVAICALTRRRTA